MKTNRSSFWTHSGIIINYGRQANLIKKRKIILIVVGNTNLISSGKETLEFPLNPVTHRGQDKELFWLDKYGNEDREELLKVDVRSLYRHEHIAPERLIKNLYRVVEDDSPQADLFGSVNELFGNALDKDELQKIEDYYSHYDGWTNRLIQGDSHLVMASLLEREGMAGQVQMRSRFFDCRRSRTNISSII